ncbi:MAG: ABC transporter permease [Muribaculaceae bacterium]|nr:ABC transporter permease [Muribaculaceae bacterium]
MNKLALYLARKLRLNTGGTTLSAIIIAVCGIALAVMIMEFSLAVVTGFKYEIRQKLSGFEAEVTVMPGEIYPETNGIEEGDITQNLATVELTSQLRSLIKEELPDAEITGVIAVPGILKTKDNFAAQRFTAYTDNPSAYDIGRTSIVNGEWPDFSDSSSINNIVISSFTASRLNLSCSERVDAVFMINGKLRSRKYTVAAIYDTGFKDYDRNIIFASPLALRSVAHLASDRVTRIDISGPGIDHADITEQKVRRALAKGVYNQELTDTYSTDSILGSGAVYLNWLSLIDTNVIVILVLMACVAGFTLVSSLFLIILERVRTIGILRSVGASGSLVRRTFMFMAMRITLYSMFIGNALGLGLLYLQKTYSIVNLDATMYYLDTVPVRFPWGELAILNAAVLIMAWCIIYIPAGYAARLDPTSTMRFE